MTMNRRHFLQSLAAAVTAAHVAKFTSAGMSQAEALASLPDSVRCSLWLEGADGRPLTTVATTILKRIGREFSADGFQMDVIATATAHTIAIEAQGLLKISLPVGRYNSGVENGLILNSCDLPIGGTVSVHSLALKENA